MIREKVVVITGGSSGIGKSTALALYDKGFKIYTVSRRPVDWENQEMFHIQGDVTEETEIQKAFEQVFAAEGRLDVLVICAGFGISGAVEFTTLEEAKKQMEVNFFGAFLALKYGGKMMRTQGFGRIIAVGSVAGEIAIPFQAFYSASKAALAKLLEAYSGELAHYHVECVLVMPGDVQTEFTKFREKSPEGDKEYEGRISRSVSKMEQDEIKGMPSEKVGQFIAKKAIQKYVRPVYGVHKGYGFLLMLYRILPRKWSLYLIERLYGN